MTNLDSQSEPCPSREAEAFGADASSPLAGVDTSVPGVEPDYSGLMHWAEDEVPGAVTQSAVDEL